MTGTVLRFDHGTIRKPVVTPEGYFRGEAVFARDGILEYKLSNGDVRKEFRPPEENQKALTKFGLKPITFEHPTELVNAENSDKYSVGMSDSTVIYDPDGYVKGVITVLNDKTVDSILKRDAIDISCGYECDIEEKPGLWKGQRYDAIQRNIRPNHIAVTRKGRAGPEVGIKLDSENSPYENIAVQVGSLTDDLPPIEKIKRMASLTLDSVTYQDIPESVAAVIGAKMQEFAQLSQRVDSLEAKLAQKDEVIAELNSNAEALTGRADGYEEIVDKALPILEKYGYEWDYQSSRFVKDSSCSEPDEDDEDMEDEEEDMPPPPKSKKKKKMDSDDDEPQQRRDDLSYLLETWDKVRELGYGERFDSNLSARDIQAEVLENIYPDLDLSGLSDSYLEGLFESSYQQYLQADEDTEDDEIRGDSADNLYAMNLHSAVNASRNGYLTNQQHNDSADVVEPWQQPLSLSK